METVFLPSNEYRTPERARLTFKDRLMLDSRIYFTLKYAGIVLKTRKRAQKKKYDTAAWAESSFYIFRFIEKAGGRFDITGMDNINMCDGPVLFISNHMSTLESMILPCIIAPRKEVTFVVKESLVKHPLFKDVMLSRNPVVVGRTDPREDLETVMTGGRELFSKGSSIVIFPQSTRSIEFKPEEFNSLGVKLAKRNNIPIVPVALKTDYWGSGKIIKELGPIDSKKTIHIKFGEPFMVSSSGKEDNNRIINFIQSSLNSWKE
ncbi:MAG: 1-acyl-sn-glycerol-3-phosphate acyltransferase [Bacteroidales bacterium]|jgi:1-acyl-sn-glycerol-3-phosphate acyltransferase|nr:1-acyl-sn-glycerol-3-phosphate acyltransferase [Bacteroidales bacterium]